MKKVWKWVIGIVIVLVIVAVVVGGVFLLRSRFGSVIAANRLVRPGVQLPGPGNVQPGVPRQFPGMRPYGDNGWGGPGMYMRGRGMMGFGGFNILGGLIRGLFNLGLLALAVLGVIWLVTRLRRPVATVTAAAPVAPAASAASTGEAAPVAALDATHPCPKCGQPVQENWKHCPNCGKRL
jgi:hypothetical protein